MDILKTVRRLLRRCGQETLYSVAVPGTIAITIALTTAMSAVLYSVVVKPLPFHESGRVMQLVARSRSGNIHPVSYPDFADWQRASRSFSDLAAFEANGSVNVTTSSGPVALHSVFVTVDFLRLLGISPMLGRGFVAEEDQNNTGNETILTYETWMNYFGGRREIVGQSIHVDDVPYTVIGVMPSGFAFPPAARNALYLPIHLTEEQRSRGNAWLQVIGRLGTGATRAQAQSEIDRIEHNLAQTYPKAAQTRVTVTDLVTSLVGDIAKPIKLLVIATFVLLIIGCANLAGLMILRNVKKRDEFMVMLALGASRADMFKDALTEAAVYSFVGTVTGITFSAVILHSLRGLLAIAVVRGDSISLSLPVMLIGAAAAATMSLAAAATALIIPFSHLRHAHFLQTKGGGRNRAQKRAQSTFIVCQFALAGVLVVLAGILFKAQSSLQAVSLGFDPSSILTLELNLASGSRANEDSVRNFYNPLLLNVAAIPGVKAAGIIQMLPIKAWGWNAATSVIGAPQSGGHQYAEFRTVSPGYYKVYGLQLVQGRYFSPQLDTPQSPSAVIVNQAFVEAFVPPGEDAIGRKIDDDGKSTIIGVVRDLRQNIFEAPMPETDYSISQIPAEETARVLRQMYLVVRVASAPTAITTRLNTVLRQGGVDVAFRAPETMPEIISSVLVFQRLETVLSMTFAVIAWILAGVGLYSTVSYHVQASLRETGIRIALGATPLAIFLQIYRYILSILGVGTLIGLSISLAMRHSLESAVTYPIHFELGYAVLLFASLLAIGLASVIVPVLRACYLPPVKVLRE